jgi:predicted enzyme related to lactoylglutathione lyase
MQTRIERNGGAMIELREPQANVPDRVATFRDSEGNGLELGQYVGPIESAAVARRRIE